MRKCCNHCCFVVVVLLFYTRFIGTLDQRYAVHYWSANAGYLLCSAQVFGGMEEVVYR